MLAIVPLRLALGAVFVTHGYLKLFSPRLGPAAFAAYLRAEGLPLPSVLAYAIGILELGCGLGVLGGVFAPIAAGLLAVHVFLALVTVGPKKGFTRLPDNAGYEYELVLFAGLLVLVLGGPTPYSLAP